MDDGTDVGIRLVPEAASALRDAGLMDPDALPSSDQALQRPKSVYRTERSKTRPRIADALRFSLAMIAANHTLRRGQSCRTFSRSRQDLVEDGTTVVALREALRRLANIRLLVPSPRRCLPASLIAARFLKALGHDVEIVFGVRSHPFAAHCWIERNGVVLNDDLDRVRSYAPIAVGRL